MSPDEAALEMSAYHVGAAIRISAVAIEAGVSEKRP